MTIVLLEATDYELQKIAKDCLTLAKRKGIKENKEYKIKILIVVILLKKVSSFYFFLNTLFSSTKVTCLIRCVKCFIFFG